MTTDTAPLPRSALLFMAAVDEARETHEGPFRALAPIFRIGLEDQKGRILDIELMAKKLSPILGETFTPDALSAFLPQLVNMGWINSHSAGNEIVYTVSNSISEFQKGEAENDSIQKLSRLYEQFRSYIGVHAPLLGIAISLEDFQWRLFQWATSLDGSDKFKVSVEADKLLRGEKPLIRDAFLDEPQRFSPIDRGLSIEFAGFTKWLAKNKKTELADLATLTELGLAREFIQEIQSPSSNLNFTVSTAFVLDAPVILDLLGLSGPSRQSSIRKCVDILKKHGAKFATLSHCLEELSEILSTVLARSIGSRYGLTGDALRANPRLVAFATAVRDQPDRAVKNIGIEVLHFDRNSPLNREYFTDQLLDEFRSSANWHDYYKTDQRDRDSMSVAYIMRRRKGGFKSDIFETPFALIARNSTFTKFAERFVRQKISAPNYAIGPVVEVKTIAAASWLRFGSEVDPKLPQIHLISACDRILASNRELLRKAESRLKELQGDDAAMVILASQQAVLDLVIATGGSAEVLSGADAEAVLQALTTTAEARGRATERSLADAEHSALEEQIKARDAALAAAAKEAADLAAKQAAANDAMSALEVASAARITNAAHAIIDQSNKLASNIVISIWFFILIFSVFGQFFIWKGNDQWWQGPTIDVALGALVIVSSGISAIGGARLFSSGRSDFAGTAQEWLTKRIVQRRIDQLEPTEFRNEVSDEIARVS